MDLYLVSLRTAFIYGPGLLLEALNPYANIMAIRVKWDFQHVFDEWEGYAVVVPEKNQVWGNAKGIQWDSDEKILTAEFVYTPMNIPSKDAFTFKAKAKLREMEAKAQKPLTADEEDD